MLVLNTGRQLILFDTGMGESMGADSKMFGPTTGRMLANMRAAGIQPEQIDLVVLSHAHCDHCWGLVDAAGNRVFPNAQVALSEADLRYWTDDSNKRGPAFMTSFIDGAKKNLSAYRDRMVMVKDGAEVVPGITAISTPGHTVGHTCYTIESDGQSMVYTGDWRTTTSCCCSGRCGNSPSTPIRSSPPSRAAACSTGWRRTGRRCCPTTSPGRGSAMWRRPARAMSGCRSRWT
ncbi:MBL fold metallo-hydrolase [Teichococcus aestuarii]|uniref:MBL fold metallo-hydrolase n=1 Tax=Teichococcus aestuarii TaxID=568898 RepID=UPI0036168E72